MEATGTQAPLMFTADWALQAAAAVNRGPDAELRASKLDTYWDWIDRARSGYTASWAIGLRETGDYLLLRWRAGWCHSEGIVPREVAGSATYRLTADEQTWRELLAGANAGRVIMYRGLRLEHGDVLQFFRGIYFFVESLAAICSVPAAPPAAT